MGTKWVFAGGFVDERTGPFRPNGDVGEMGEGVGYDVCMPFFTCVCGERCAGASSGLLFEHVDGRGAYGNVIGGTNAGLRDSELFDPSTAKVRYGNGAHFDSRCRGIGCVPRDTVSAFECLSSIFFFHRCMMLQ